MKMDDVRKKLTEMLEDAEEITLKNFTLNAENIGFEIKPGGGVPPQLPIRLVFNNQMFTGYVNTQGVRKSE